MKTWSASDNSRDRHWFGPGPKRILALDGGGVRGILALAILEKMEAELAAQAGKPVRLCDHFDLIGGTSTGAIIAAGLALGISASDIRKMYEDHAPRIFRRVWWRLQGLQSKFDAGALTAQIKDIVGTRSLDSEDLQTGFAIVAKRLDTGSAWTLSNNPRTPYWNTQEGSKTIGNRHYPLANVVRASAAAPHFFDPELLPIATGEPHGLFVDGAVTPHNNPSLALFLLARAKAYGVEWPVGPENLTIISVGTGNFRARLSLASVQRQKAIGVAFHALTGMIGDAQQQILAMMQWFGECPAPRQINAEIGTLAGEYPGAAPLFRFVRYDVELEPAAIAALGVTLGPNDLLRLRQLDDPGILKLAYEIGQKAAAAQVQGAHFS